MIRYLSTAMKVLLATLFILVSVRGASASDRDDVKDWFSKNWYVTEVIIFQRSSVMEYSSNEKFVLLAERRFPYDLRTLIPQANELGSFYTLDPRTRAMLDFPTFDFERDNFSYLLPREQTREHTDETDDLIVTFEREFEEAENESQSSMVSILAPPTGGQPPPPIDPILEPNPLLDFLAALNNFERSLQERSYRWLATDELLLRREARRIGSRDELHILLHGHWVQPVPERSQPEPLLVQNRTRIGNTQQLEGTLAVTLGRYLHFRATLWYREPAIGLLPVDIPLGDVFLDVGTGIPGGDTNIFGGDTNIFGGDTNIFGGTNIFRDTSGARLTDKSRGPTLPEPGKGYMLLSESRRLRSEEIHYLDHPKLGIIVRINPVEIPEELSSRFAALEEANEQLRDTSHTDAADGGD